MSTTAVVLFVLAIAAFVLIALRAAGIAAPRGGDLGWAGVALLVLVYIIQTVTST